jgi:hypothetical protein
MITLDYDDCPVTIELCASICNDPLAWSEGADWLAEHCTWFHVMRGGLVVGFMAWVDTDKGRLMHYGTADGAENLGLAMLKAFRMAVRVASKEGATLCAYIEPTQSHALRLARAVGFTQKEKNLYEIS